MPSPFPGMNPYLEQPDAWHAFHQHFCPACLEALVPQTRPRYICRPDPDAVLDLRAVLDRVYDAAGYEDYIYAGSPVPPLSPEDQRWAKDMLEAVRESGS